MYKAHPSVSANYAPSDLFMGFHCGNTPICHLRNAKMEHQLIMKRSLEPDKEPDITRGTLDGQIKPSEVTLFRLQATADCQLRAYVAEGEVLDVDPKSFGGIGVIAVKDMGRFYRHVLVGRQFPHHAAVGFNAVGRQAFEVLKLLGVSDIGYPKPKDQPYPGENPFM